ncbi:MAG TPA: DMT family transporter [Acidimicrobiales bacterium]|nr:DMT family transporter [Acidimicrobiales bacterium]
MTWAATLVAVITAVVNAASNVLQRAANRSEPRDLALSPRLVLHLLRRPLWLAGFGAVIASFLLQATALRLGTLAGVQPIIILELPLTLVGAAVALKANIGRREWLATGGAAAGVAAFLAALDPSGGSKGHAPAGSWLAAGASTVLVIGAVTAAGAASKGGRRAALLGVATGVCFGLTAALMKGMTGRLDGGIAGVLVAWQTYAMVAAGLVGMFLLQNALHAGPLVAGQPGITLADPAVAVLWGVLVFHESIRGGAFALVAVAAAVAIGVSTVALTRSPLLENRERVAEGPGDPSASGPRERPRGQAAGPEPRRAVLASGSLARPDG